ncbi:MAG: phosphotransferase family protein [Acidimicrobiales bacterium]
MLRAAGLPFGDALQPASSTNNEIHLSERCVVRVSDQSKNRLAREGALYRHLPTAPWRPALIAAGQQAGADYVIVERKPGRPLAHAWPSLSVMERRRAVGQLARCLRELHAVTTPDLPPIAGKPLHVLGSGRGPEHVTDPLLRALDHVSHHPAVDTGIVELARHYVLANRDHLDDHRNDHLIHGDVTFENVLADEGQITALIDFEWCRGAPADLELDVLLRCCALPQVHVAAEYAARSRPQDYAAVPVWLAEDYPELFAHPHLVERLTIYALAFDVRDLIETGTVPAQRSDVDDLHPYNRLINLVSTGGHVAELLDRAGVRLP